MEIKKILKLLVIISMSGIFFRQIFIKIESLGNAEVARILSEEFVETAPHPSLTACLFHDLAYDEELSNLTYGNKTLEQIYEAFPNMHYVIGSFKPQRIPPE